MKLKTFCLALCMICSACAKNTSSNAQENLLQNNHRFIIEDGGNVSYTGNFPQDNSSDQNHNTEGNLPDKLLVKTNTSHENQTEDNLPTGLLVKSNTTKHNQEGDMPDRIVIAKQNDDNTPYVVDTKKSVIKAGDITFVESQWNEMQGITQEDWLSVVQNYASVCEKFIKQDNNDAINSSAILLGYAKDYKKVCNDISKLNSQNSARQYFLQNFMPYLVYNNTEKTNFGTFTGYYYPTLKASRTQTAHYKYPIYKKPDDLSNYKYYTRSEIDNGVLQNKGLEIFWVDDFVDLYYLHIQGSGMLEIDDGTVVHIKFSAKNNRPYTSLGKYMLSRGLVKSESEIKTFLYNNYDIAHDILAVNQSYVFFEENPLGNVIGSHGSSLVDGRSLAVDNKYIPYGAMLFIQTHNINKVMFAQDSGSAIKGVIRGDIFFGKGQFAGEVAKKMYHQGKMYILVHKSCNIKPL